MKTYNEYKIVVTVFMLKIAIRVTKFIRYLVDFKYRKTVNLEFMENLKTRDN